MKNDIIFQRCKVCSSKVIQYGQFIVGIVKGRKSIITNYLLPLGKLATEGIKIIISTSSRKTWKVM